MSYTTLSAAYTALKQHTSTACQIELNEIAKVSTVCEIEKAQLEDCLERRLNECAMESGLR